MAHPVVYFELYGPDPRALGSFYSELLGWSLNQMPGMDYAMVDTNGGAGISGGIAANPDKTAAQLFYVETADLQETLDKAESLGASTTMPVTTIPNGPTIAMFSDPVGNPIGLVAPPADGNVVGPSTGEGCAVGWFEIHGGPFDAQRRFYSDLFGWTISVSENPGFTYGEIQNPVSEYGMGGALSASEDGRTGIVLWASVDDPQKYLEKAESLGARTETEPMKANEHLTVATFIDPQGNRFGLFTYDG